MENKEKVQVVIIAKNQGNHEVLILQMNEKRSGFWQNVTGSVEPEDKDLLAAAKENYLKKQISMTQKLVN